MEHQGFIEHRVRLEREIRDALRDNKHGIDADAVTADLFVDDDPAARRLRKDGVGRRPSR